jgi:hypothetical protein
MNSIDMIARSGQRQILSPIRPRFVADFGEAQAVAIEQAAQGHKNGVHDNEGSDAFRYAIVMCIGYQCVAKNADYHGITVPFETFKAWVREHAELDRHDGDCDFLALFCGVYQAFMPGATDDKTEAQR